MDYEMMKKAFMKGIKTWNVRSVLSHVHMPSGFSLNLAFTEYSCEFTLKDISSIHRNPQNLEK